MILIKMALGLSLITRRLNKNPDGDVIYGFYTHADETIRAEDERATSCLWKAMRATEWHE